MKKTVFAICVLASTIVTLFSSNSTRNVLLGNIEALSQKEFFTGYSYLVCYEENEEEKCYSFLPGGNLVEYPALGGMIEVYFTD